MSKRSPTPVRFTDKELSAITALSEQTGFPVSEIIRRSVRLLLKTVAETGQIDFILSASSPSATDAAVMSILERASARLTDQPHTHQQSSAEGDPARGPSPAPAKPKSEE